MKGSNKLLNRVLRFSKYGYTYEIDAEYIAKDRAEWYKDDSDYQDEYDYTMSNPYELEDWYRSNMDWKDIPDQYKRVFKIPPLAMSPYVIEDIDNDKWIYEVLDVEPRIR